MDALWQWQVRIGFSEDFAIMVQGEPSNLALTSLNDVLADYVSAVLAPAGEHGIRRLLTNSEKR